MRGERCYEILCSLTKWANGLRRMLDSFRASERLDRRRCRAWPPVGMHHNPGLHPARTPVCSLQGTGCPSPTGWCVRSRHALCWKLFHQSFPSGCLSRVTSTWSRGQASEFLEGVIRIVWTNLDSTAGPLGLARGKFGSQAWALLWLSRGSCVSHLSWTQTLS